MVQATRKLPDSAPLVVADDHDSVVYSGNRLNGVTEDFDASLQIAVYSEGFTLKLGTDVDRSLCDVYVDNVFWGSLDTYAATPGELAVTIPLARLGLHVVEIRNRPERNTACVPASSTSFKLEFKQLETAYDGHAIDYSYDDLSRLLAADYFAAWDAVNPVRDYTFAYDVAGNRTSEVVNVNGSPFSSQTHTYDAANRISNAGFAYNDAGQMTADGTLSYSWDRAGRLLGAGDSSYAYNGLGQRVQQTVSGVVTDYLLDVQPGLAKVIAAMTGANTERFVHERGLLSQQDNGGVWHWAVNDGLGSVRVQADGDFDVEGSRLFAPYGVPFGEQGAFDVPFAFTGEMLDANGLQYHRARYYNPALGAFPSLDPVEGVLQQAMSLNRYAYVAGNVVNLVDPSGMIARSEIANGNPPRVQYSCRCGWIDWDHVQTFNASQLRHNLRLVKEFADGPARDYHFLYYGIRYTMSLSKGPFTDHLLDDYAFINAFLVNSPEFYAVFEPLVAGIFKEANERFELSQYNRLYAPLFPRLRRSAFSEEDLVSDLIGLYLSREYSENTPAARSEVNRLCYLFDKEDSLYVWDNTYGAHGAEFSDEVISMYSDGVGWRNWDPRLLVLLDECGNIITDENNNFGRCNWMFRRGASTPTNYVFPSQFWELMDNMMPSELAPSTWSPDMVDTWFWLLHSGNPRYMSEGHWIGYVSDTVVGVEPNINY